MQIDCQMILRAVASARVLEGDEKTFLGVADRILSLTEGEAEHRRAMEKRIVSALCVFFKGLDKAVVVRFFSVCDFQDSNDEFRPIDAVNDSELP